MTTTSSFMSTVRADACWAADSVSTCVLMMTSKSAELGTLDFGVSRRVSGEEEIPSLDRLVAGIAGRHLRLGRRLSVLVELGVSPASRRGVFPGVLDHELEVPVGRVAGHPGLLAAEDLVVLLGRRELPSDPRDDRAVRERQRLVAIRLDRDVVAEDRADVVQRPGLVGDRHEPPVAVALGNLRDVDLLVAVTRSG